MSSSHRPKTLHFITGNANKLVEVQAILGIGGKDGSPTVELTSKKLDLEEIQGSIEQIARAKASTAAKEVGGPVLTEDTALEFRALKGLPGPYIKWFLEAVGHDGLNKLVEPYEDKTIESVCTFAYCAGPGQEVVLFQGRTEGKIVPARGSLNFGWDAIFEYETGQTYSEMDKAYKNTISHRYKALMKLKKWLEETKPVNL